MKTQDTYTIKELSIILDKSKSAIETALKNATFNEQAIIDKNDKRRTKRYPNSVLDELKNLYHPKVARNHPTLNDSNDSTTQLNEKILKEKLQHSEDKFAILQQQSKQEHKSLSKQLDQNNALISELLKSLDNEKQSLHQEQQLHLLTKQELTKKISETTLQLEDSTTKENELKSQVDDLQQQLDEEKSKSFWQRIFR